MQEYKSYQIALPENYSDSPQAFAELVSRHGQLFEGAVMSRYAYDLRYSYLADTFTVTEVDSEHFGFNVDLRYFEGCRDKDERVPVSMRVGYQWGAQHIIFTLDETVWSTDN